MFYNFCLHDRGSRWGNIFLFFIFISGFYYTIKINLCQIFKLIIILWYIKYLYLIKKLTKKLYLECCVVYKKKMQTNLMYTSKSICMCVCFQKRHNCHLKRYDNEQIVNHEMNSLVWNYIKIGGPFLITIGVNVNTCILILMIFRS